MPFDRLERLRNYQVRAIQAIEASIRDGRRELLVAQATGTGKTYQTVALLYRLLESKVARRILFLVDRRALAAQAVREFAAFNTPSKNKFTQEYEVYSQKFRREDLDDDKPFDPKVLPTEYLTEPKSSQTFVYVSTIQRMAINLLGYERAFPQAAGDAEVEEDAGKLDIPIHAFDLIVADECHRGYTAQETGTWREVMNYFDAVKVGLTATPAAHTISIFGEPVFRYGVEEAIREGHLVDYDAVAIRSDVRMNGVFLEEGEQVGKIDTTTGEMLFDEVEDEREFPAQEVERRITAEDSNRKIIQEVARYARQHEEETGRFPKTLIFAVNDIAHTSHADQLVRLCREVFNQGDDFVQKITGKADRPLQLIRQFRNRPSPKVVVSVDMLSTGVDIPALEFIVFLRPVKSRILWEQMLGRGTRLCRDIDKSKFVVFDCFDGTLIQYFKDVSNFKIETPAGPPLSIAEVIENIYGNVERRYYTNVLVKRLRRIEKDMSAKAREQFSRFIVDGDMGRFASELPGALDRDFTKTMKLLRDPAFQDLLVNYPRAKRTFLYVPDAGDAVTSKVMERFDPYGGASGYLEAFSKFVHENSDTLDALKVLLKRPKGWNPDALDELRQALRERRFDEPRLQRAHECIHHKALADIISMVRHAARGEEPILTAEERVSRVLERLHQEHDFTEEQEKWLGYIREHLVKRLTVSPDDFEEQPIFNRCGGLGRARQIFKDDFTLILEQINTLIAAYGAPQ
jgi:type I restriction enzyme R subunit